MKINYKNTCLHFLDDPERMSFYIPEPAKPMTEAEKNSFGRSLRDGFKDVVPLFKQRIRYACSTFWEAYLKGKSRLTSVLDQEDIEEAGTLIFPGVSRTNTMFYYIKKEGCKENWQCNYFIALFTKEHKEEDAGLDMLTTLSGETEKNFMWKGYADQGLETSFWVAHLLGFLLFLKYAELETKVVKAGRRDHHVGEKYLNETKLDIEILDSTWFTTIVRSEGFKVGGHFRLQPHGPGMSQRKLIWISDFEKHGYTRKAKIINNESQNV